MKDENKDWTNTDASAAGGGGGAAASAAAFVFTTIFTVVATAAAAEAAAAAPAAEASFLVKLLFSSFIFHSHFNFLIFSCHWWYFPPVPRPMAPDQEKGRALHMTQAHCSAGKFQLTWKVNQPSRLDRRFAAQLWVWNHFGHGLVAAFENSLVRKTNSTCSHFPMVVWRMMIPFALLHLFFGLRGPPNDGPWDSGRHL